MRGRLAINRRKPKVRDFHFKLTQPLDDLEIDIDREHFLTSRTHSQRDSHPSSRCPTTALPCDPKTAPSPCTPASSGPRFATKAPPEAAGAAADSTHGKKRVPGASTARTGNHAGAEPHPDSVAAAVAVCVAADRPAEGGEDCKHSAPWPGKRGHRHRAPAPKPSRVRSRGHTPGPPPPSERLPRTTNRKPLPASPSFFAASRIFSA